ncbi:phage tail tape measure protein [Enterococcus casseliflavus]|uniref:phage tail tape measure protein n=1 Tax=Enterococcus casseliflavus TaxID=37734 RepID=UPI002952E114|nr:phage tail tape measure protein [Enterococcus casseliflavus]MDV7711293.1 phage tail tape measure protein [Enterococcus casseliflavus]
MAGATPLGNMVIKLGLDDADFGKGVANSKKQVQYLAKEMQANMKVADLAGNKLGKLGTRYDSLTQIIKAQENQVTALKKAYDGSFVDGKATDSTKRLANQLQDANGKLANYKLQLQNTAGQMARLQVETQGVTGWLKQHGDAYIKQGEKIQKFGDSVSKVGSTLTKAITLPVAAGFTVATKAASDFTTQIGEIGPLLTNGQAITTEYKQQLEQMGESSKQWAKDYGVSTTEINQGLAEVVRKGYDANQTMGVMPAILDATKASGDAFNDVMNVSTEVISQFNLKGKDYETTVQNATRVTDSLTYVANATSAGFTDLGLAMSYVGPVANSLNMSVEETAAAIGLLSDAGIGGEKAGTALRGALTRLLKPSDQNIAGFEQLGISVDAFKEGTLTLPDILDKIKTNTQGWTDAQRTSAIALAFGTESQSAMNVLVNQGGDALRNLTSETESASGATKKIADSMKDLPANKVARFKESLNVLAITFGEKLLPLVTPWIEKATDMVNSFSELDDATQNNIVKWGLMAAAAGPALKLLGGGISTIGSVTKGVGKLSTGIVELVAASAEKKALATLATSVTGVGTAASGAAGSAGVGALTTALGTGGLAGALPLIVGAGGLLAVGYGAWKLFGEEAWNSSQRVQRWGTDVGEAVDGTLTKVQDNTQKASGQFGLMADGFATNSDSMISNFEKIGQTIEDSLVKKVEGLDKLIKELPESVNSSVSEMVEDEKVKAESALQTVQENTARITEIKKAASNSNREISVSEAKIIQDLAKNTTQAYVETLDVSANEKKKILAAMNADVANATEEEAKLWLQSLGKQRQIAQQNATLSRQEKEKYLQDLGYNLDGEFAKKFLAAWDEINSTTVKGFDSQMETILKKYPELQNEVSLANGQLISSMGDYADSAIAENEKILKSTSDLSRELASNAEKNAEKISWTASESSKAGKKAAQTWNDLVFDEKTGEVKSNVAEVVTEATKDSLTWNNLKLVVHDADLDSNAKDVIGEAAIANGWWDGMAWSDKKAVLQDEFSITMYKALEDSGKWAEMSFDEKKAFLYSNTPEVMAETMLNLGMWEQFQPQIKNLNAENYDLLNALSFSKTSLNEYNALDPEVKRLIAEDPATLTVSQSKKMLETYNSVSPELKRLLGDNTNVNSILANSKSKINDYNATGVGAKHLHATADYSEVLRAKSEIAQVYSKNVVIDVEYRGRRTGQTAIPNAKGTNYHPGGDMIVNDQSGPLYKELVQFPGQAPFIPQGRNVYIPNAPAGTKVARASLTKSIMRRLAIPKYADGVGIPEDSSLVRNLRNLTPSTESSSINVRTQDYSQQLEILIEIMSNFGEDLKNMKLFMDTKVVGGLIDKNKKAQERSEIRRAGGTI